LSYALELSIAPTVEPVTSAEARVHLRVDTSDDDTKLTSLIKAARKYTETLINQQFITATWKLYLDEFPSSNQIEGCFYKGSIIVPRSPIQLVTSIKYYDTDDVLQTWDSDEYQYSAKKNPGRIATAYGYNWPTHKERMDAVVIEYISGYGDAGSDVPEQIREAILLLVGHFYEFDTPFITGMTVNALPLSYRALVGSCSNGWLW